MTLLPSRDDVGVFRSLLADRLGLQFDESKLASLTRTLADRMAATGLGCHQYLDQLSTRRAPLAELAALAEVLTVTETYFLRNIDQFTAFVNIALPERLSSTQSGAVQVLSIGCASGDEPYSLAIAIREHMPDAAQHVRIIAADVNLAMLQKAKRARYSPWSLRDVSPAIQARWFKPDGPLYALDDAITSAVTFEHRNVAADDPDFWQSGRFDIVFCRNMLMYFTPDQAQAAVQRIAHTLVPGGYLFLGHAETLRGLSNDFHVCHTNDAFYYRRDQESTADYPPLPPPSSTRWAALPLGDTSWIENIQRASERIQELSRQPNVTTNTLGDASAARVAADLTPAFDLLNREHYGKALAHLDSLPMDHRGDPDVQLLKAVLLSNSGALSEAEAMCQSLLKNDELNAGAHYVLALCREGVGDLSGALEQDQLAAYLDPDFAMPRIHMGLLARRRGDFQAAAREMRRAIPLLQREDAARLLMFGGGFKREALMAICKAEPVRMGDR